MRLHCAVRAGCTQGRWWPAMRLSASATPHRLFLFMHTRTLSTALVASMAIGSIVFAFTQDPAQPPGDAQAPATQPAVPPGPDFRTLPSPPAEVQKQLAACKVTLAQAMDIAQK